MRACGLRDFLDATVDASLLREVVPYSTYTHEGLPPGPIANPGACALEAR